MRRPLALLVPVLIAPFPLAAQRTVAAPGDSVRVTAPTIWSNVRKGTLVSLRSDSLTFRDKLSGGGETTIPVASVSEFDVNHGNVRGPSHVWAGIGIGAVAGAGLGAIIGGASYTPPPPCSSWLCFNGFDDRSTHVAAGAIAGAFAGMLVGGIIGGTASRGDGYEKVDLAKAGTIARALSGEGTVTVAPVWTGGRGQGGVAVVVRF